MLGFGAGHPATPFLSRQSAQKLYFWLLYALNFHKRLRGDEGGEGGLDWRPQGWKGMG